MIIISAVITVTTGITSVENIRCTGISATEAAAIGVIGSLIIAASQRTLNRRSFFGALMGATRLYCMIALILAGSAFLTLAMGYIGLPRHLAEWIGALGLSPAMLLVALYFEFGLTVNALGRNAFRYFFCAMSVMLLGLIILATKENKESAWN